MNGLQLQLLAEALPKRRLQAETVEVRPEDLLSAWRGEAEGLGAAEAAAAEARAAELTRGLAAHQEAMEESRRAVASHFAAAEEAAGALQVRREALQEQAVAAAVEAAGSAAVHGVGEG